MFIDKKSMQEKIETLLKEIDFYKDFQKLSKEEQEKILAFKESFINQNFEIFSNINSAIAMSKNNESNNENIKNNTDNKNNESISINNTQE